MHLISENHVIQVTKLNFQGIYHFELTFNQIAELNFQRSM